MNLSKKTLNVIGVLALLLIVGGSGMFIIKPQLEKASANNKSIDESGHVLHQQELKLAELRREESNLSAIRAEVAQLEKEITPDPDIASIARTVVDNLKISDSSSVRLQEFAHYAPVEFKVGDAPTVGLDAKSLEFSDEPASSDGSKAEGKTFMMVPVSITVEAKSDTLITQYVDSLRNSDRIIRIDSIGLSGSKEDRMYSAVLQGYAFML